VSATSVTLTQLSSTSPSVSLNPATGAVTVAPGTAAGIYTLVYRLCENLNPANCDTASVTVDVIAATIVVSPDERSIDSSGGGTLPPSVLDNDTLDGSPVDPVDVTLVQVSSTSPSVSLDTVTGQIVVAAGTPAGTYTVIYEACELLNPANCGSAAITVTVAASALEASPDARSLDGSLGGSAPPSVLGNDTLDDVPIDASDVVLTQVSSTSPNVTLNLASGQVGVAPGTPAGSYTLVYEICEVINPANCDQAAVTVNVTAAALLAIDDSGSVNGSAGGTAGPSVLANDRLGDVPVDPASVTLVQVSSTSPNVSLDPATGRVSVAPGTLADTYTLVYQVCENLNPVNCDTATAAVTVTAASLVANPDARSIGGLNGGTAVPSVLSNDTLNGAPASAASVTLTQVSTLSPNLILDTSTGELTVAPGTPAGTYTLVYEICEKLNPANCSQGTVTVSVTAAPLVANADAGSAAGGGTAIASVLGNDTLDGSAVVPGSVVLRQISTSDPGVTLDPATGAVTVASGTAAGTYTLTYEVCEILNPSNCATAPVTVRVTAGSLVARTDSAGAVDGNAGGVVIANVLENDTLNGVPVSAASVTLTQVSSTSPNVTLNPATGGVSVAAGTAPGTYTLVYEICEVSNPANCARATVTVTVTVADLTPTAVDDQFTAQEGEAVRGDLAANDTPGNLPGTYALVAGAGPAHGVVTISADGSFEYEAGPGFVGTDSFSYRVCDADGDCASAVARITITPEPGKLRIQKTASTHEVTPGALVAFTVTLTNVSSRPVTGADLVDRPPPGLSLVAGSVQVLDEDGMGQVQGAGPFTISGIDVPAGATATVRYLMRVSAGLPEGEYANRATALQLGAAISNTASAKVARVGGSDPVTEQVRVLGKVFDDRDGDGWQDDNERGIPGVRLATLEGLVAETDAFGRYHFEGLTVSNSSRGQNFLIKVDAATLPRGSRFTTENPLIRRVTQGLPARFDFGVRLPSRREGAAPGERP
jgi:uncharacterized repeat protein (TIGR01451 family)